MGPTLCPTVENPDLVLQEAGISQGLTHFKPAESGSRQANQTGPDYPNRAVSPPKGILFDMQQPQIDLFATRFNNKLPQFLSQDTFPGQWMHSTCLVRIWTHEHFQQ